MHGLWQRVQTEAEAEEEIVYWANRYDWHPDRKDRDAFTWIAGRQLRWRDASLWMRERLRYGPGSGE